MQSITCSLMCLQGVILMHKENCPLNLKQAC
jgi:hypothetical protein